jgi:hypothetical protein
VGSKPPCITDGITDTDYSDIVGGLELWSRISLSDKDQGGVLLPVMAPILGHCGVTLGGSWLRISRINAELVPLCEQSNVTCLFCFWLSAILFSIAVEYGYVLLCCSCGL